MKKALICIKGIMVFAMLAGFTLCGPVFAFTDNSSDTMSMKLSKTDLKKYFEKAMFLFESGKYQEAV
ncbi:MAG: hypothetical protein KKH08_06505, partial [Candidatus Omnitrophica bacterium]|nr:hypothetical protein [Candidatus Omnitrophota bacterium]